MEAIIDVGFLWAGRLAIILGFITVTGFSLWKVWGVRKIEQALCYMSPKSYTLEYIEGEWNDVRILWTVFFTFGIICWGKILSASMGYPHLTGGLAMLQNLLVGFSVFGLFRLGLYLARIWLKFFAPQIYQIYKPYYSPRLRQEINYATETYEARVLHAG